MTYEVAWHIHEVQIFRTDELHRRTFEQTVMLFADVSCVVDGLPRDLMDVGSGADDANCEDKPQISEITSRTSARKA